MNEKNKMILVYAEKYKKVIDYVQMIALGLIIIALFSRYMKWADLGQLLVVGLCSIAFVFGVKGVVARHNSDYGDMIMNLGLSVLSMGLLYRFKNWPDMSEMVYGGGAAAIVGFVVKLIFPKTNNSANNNSAE